MLEFVAQCISIDCKKELTVVLRGSHDGCVSGSSWAVIYPVGCQEHFGASVWSEEERGRKATGEEEVIVEIDPVLSETGDVVQSGLDGVRVEGGQVSGIVKDFRVVHHRHP